MANAVLLRGVDFEGGTTRDESAGQIPSTMREVYEMMCVTQGSADYWIEDQHYRLRAGDILIIPAGVMVGASLKPRGCPFERHGLWMTRRFMTFLMLQDERADYIFSLASQNSNYLLRLPTELFEGIQAEFEALAAESADNAFNAELSCKAMVSTLMVQLNRIVRIHEEYMQISSDNRLSPVLRYIHENCTQPLTVEGLAEQFEYSPSHLAHSFKKQMGTSLYHYILVRRLQIGREAMLSGVPVKEAYLKCGFGDYAGFYRAFIKEFGLSPQQYKKRNQ